MSVSVVIIKNLLRTTYLNFIMRNHLILLFAICFTFSFHSQSQVKTGLLFQGGSGMIKAVIEPAYLESIISYDIYYKNNFSIGYRFQIKQAGASLFLTLMPILE